MPVGQGGIQVEGFHKAGSRASAVRPRVHSVLRATSEVGTECWPPSLGDWFMVKEEVYWGGELGWGGSWCGLDSKETQQRQAQIP